MHSREVSLYLPQLSPRRHSLMPRETPPQPAIFPMKESESKWAPTTPASWGAAQEAHFFPRPSELGDRAKAACGAQHGDLNNHPQIRLAGL